QDVLLVVHDQHQRTRHRRGLGVLGGDELPGLLLELAVPELLRGLAPELLLVGRRRLAEAREAARADERAVGREARAPRGLEGVERAAAGEAFDAVGCGRGHDEDRSTPIRSRYSSTL